MEQKSNKLIITRLDNRILTAWIENGKTVQMSLEDGNGSSLNNIYIGKVKNIVKNINAAFVELENGKMGYYSLTENRNHLFVRPHKSNSLREGDEIIVQVSRDAVKTKAPVLSCYLNFTGRYSVLTLGKNTIGFSAKIKEESWKKEIRPLLLDVKDDDFGIIVRTNAKDMPKETLLHEVKDLKYQKEKLLNDACYRTCFSCLYQSFPAYVAGIRDTYTESMDEIITDDPVCHRALETYLKEQQPEDAGKLRFYQDPMLSLFKLYSLESAMEQAVSEKVWLKSGGYLVIEQTEALSVIDVNTGKYDGHKNMADTVLKINLEAAKEIAYQLRLRNLSGIIVVDFIDMERQADKDTLLDTMGKLTARDPVKTTVIDMTKLNLVEITRKKVKRPFYEQLKNCQGD